MPEVPWLFLWVFSLTGRIFLTFSTAWLRGHNLCEAHRKESECRIDLRDGEVQSTSAPVFTQKNHWFHYTKQDGSRPANCPLLCQQWVNFCAAFFLILEPKVHGPVGPRSGCDRGILHNNLNIYLNYAVWRVFPGQNWLTFAPMCRPWLCWQSYL